jgi:hypothetical protein
MNVHSEIDDTLRRLGSVDPPLGLEARINQRLQVSRNASRNRFSASMTRTIAACALAASVALSAVVLNPALRSRLFHHHTSAQSAPPVNSPRTVAPASGGFGTASAVHVPVEPVPVEATPLNQGRGRSRTGRAVLPTGNLAPLPRGVAAPHAPPAVAPDSTR